MSETTTIRMSFLVVSLLAIIWLGIGFYAMAEAGKQPESLFEAIQTFGLMIMPVATLYALAAALGQKEHIPILDKSDSIEETEARLAGAVTRIDALRNSMAGELSGLAETAESLERQSRGAQKLVAELQAASNSAVVASEALSAVMPQALAAAQELRAAIATTASEAAEQARRADASAAALAASLGALSSEGEKASASLGESLERLSVQAERGRSQSEAGMRSIRGETDTLFEVLENTAVAKREAMGRQAEAMLAQLAEAQAKLESMATAAAGQLAERLEALSAKAEAIEGRLKAQASMTESLATSGERAFQLLDARLLHSNETSRTSLDRLSARVQEVNSEIAGLTLPLKDTQGAAQDLEGAVRSLREVTMQTVDVLGETLPNRTVEAGRAAEALTAELMELVSAIDGAYTRAAALADPIAESRAAIDSASEAYAAQRTAIEAAGRALVVELQQARTLIGEVEEQTRDTSLSAASRLVEAMTRVREVSAQTTGTMREMLEGVIAEAREALATAADEAMRHGFAEPVAIRAREAEAAAAAAAERTASSMAALANTLKLLEERSADRIGHFESAQQEDLLASATLLTDRLSQASISISSALGKPMDDADWTQWRKGERGFFSRRVHSLLDKREAKELKGLIAEDSEFAAAARSYTSAFDALVRRFEGPAPALAAAIQGSEQGRLAAALSEVLEG
ncbi:coiled-coil domain-containing protein [Sandaracinobacteroides hominis]|uniref:hypothetical protein n=1 Tax=Sandaracinobacteroides hominis TaxID=2780086 RepID=UPI0018F5AD4E|nr:hypothetical protein [Sandaracinobacteroides hominis]